MIHQVRFLEAMKESGVSRVAVIDDAFDPPVVDADNAGALLEFFEDVSSKETLVAAGVDESLIVKALEALRRSELDDENIVAAIDIVYRHFVETLDPSFDPGGMFKTAKGDNLKNIIPLLKLLAQCDPKLTISRVGSKPEDLETVGDDTHLIFVDFYLDPTLQAGEAPQGLKGANAKSASLDRVRRLVAGQTRRAPSVVLMSSHQVRASAEAFRTEIGGGRVFASRFGFVEKTQLSLSDGDAIAIEPDAAYVLLDIIQSFEFGRAVHVALDFWLTSAAKAVGDLRGEIEKIDLKDFAYLVRFRLAQEGQGLLEYLEWFFGECLLDGVGKAVDKGIAGGESATLSDAAASRIEGSFDGPTKKVAELYHRVRIEDPRSSRASSFRLGDLYLLSSGPTKSVAAIITPDCDLIPRAGRSRAPRLLVVNGKLKPLDSPDSSVSDFLMLQGQPHNVIWDTKAVATHAFEEWPAPGASNESCLFLGTLRPHYAQELQREVLNDLGRVGLSVAPAIGMTAAVTVTVKLKAGGKRVLGLPLTAAAPATVIPNRGGDDKTKVIFRRQFVSTMIDTLNALDSTTLPAASVGEFEQLKWPKACAKLQKMLSGVQLEETIDLGIFLTSKPSYKSPNGGPWCWLTISMEVAETIVG